MELEQPLSKQEFDYLSDYLAIQASMTLVSFFGFVAAVVSNPNLIPPMIWLPELFGEDKFFEDKEQAQIIIGLISRIEYQLRCAIKSEDPLQAFLLSESGALVFKENDSLKLWCFGFLEGAKLDEDYWFSERYHEVTEGIEKILILAGDQDDVAEYLEHRPRGQDIEDVQSAFRNALPQVLKELYQFGRGLLVN